MDLPDFRNSQEAVAFGRAHPEAVPDLRERARKAEQRMEAASILKDWTAALRHAFVAQLQHEAIDAAEHPDRETPIERLEREEREKL
jgi:hypothetical protein